MTARTRIPPECNGSGFIPHGHAFRMPTGYAQGVEPCPGCAACDESIRLDMEALAADPQPGLLVQSRIPGCPPGAVIYVTGIKEGYILADYWVCGPFAFGYEPTPGRAHRAAWASWCSAQHVRAVGWAP